MDKRKGKESGSDGPGGDGKCSDQPSSSRQGDRSRDPQVVPGQAPEKSPQKQKAKSRDPHVGPSQAPEQSPQKQKTGSRDPHVGPSQAPEKSPQKQKAKSRDPHAGPSQAPEKSPQKQKVKSKDPHVGPSQASEKSPQKQKVGSKDHHVGPSQAPEKSPQKQKAGSRDPHVGPSQVPEKSPQKQKAKSRDPHVGPSQAPEQSPQKQKTGSRDPHVGPSQAPEKSPQKQKAKSRDPHVGPSQAPEKSPQKQKTGYRDPSVGPSQASEKSPQKQKAGSKDPHVGPSQAPEKSPQKQKIKSRDPQAGPGQAPEKSPQKQKAGPRDPHVDPSQAQKKPHQKPKIKSRDPHVESIQSQKKPHQKQKDRSRDPQVDPSQASHEPPQKQKAWSRSSQVGSAQTPHELPQQQKDRFRVPHSGPGQAPEEPPQKQKAWSSGPQVGPSWVPHEPPQQQGAWSGGPQVGPSWVPHEPPQQQGAWSGGPQVGSSWVPHAPSQQQGAWSGGPQVGSSWVPHAPSQQQGAWSGGPQVGLSWAPYAPSQPQGAWSGGPQVGPSWASHEPPQQLGALYGRPSDKSIKQEMKIPRKKDPEKEKQSPAGDASPSSVEFAPRIYAPGRSGKEIQVASNFYPLIISDPNINIFHYDVEIDPQKPKYLIREVWHKFVSLMFPSRLTAFDGKNAYSKGPLTEERSISATVTVLNIENNREKEFKVAIKEVRRISLSCFHNFLEKMRRDRSMKVLPEAELNVLDIIMRNWACDNFVKNGKNFFGISSTNPRCVDLSKKLSMRFGYFQTAFLGYKLYLNFDISHKAFYKSCSILDILDCFRTQRNRDLDIDQMTHFLRHVKVEYALPNLPSSKRVVRVNKLVNDANRQTFTKEDGTVMTVAKYFEIEKKCRLNYPNLPLLWVGPTQKTVYVPMEFCTILPDQIYSGIIDPSEVRVMVQKSTSNARDRRSNVQAVFNKTNINSHPLMKEFGLRVSNEMERVPARVLDPPRLKTSRNIRVDHGVWRIQDFLEPMSLNKWCILNLDKYLHKQSIDNLKNMIKSKGNDFNMRVADPAKTTIDAEFSFSALKNTFSQLKDMQLVFVIIPDIKLVYSRVKAICETQDGILTQCVKSKTVSQDPRRLMTTVQNILLKVNAKLGGKNHCLDQSSTPPCLNGYVMVAGADVTHPSPGMTIPSVAAVTVSCEPAAFQYSTTTRVQPKGEMIKDLEDIMSKHVKEFNKIRGRYPEKIIFFRDGVSEGELEKVFKEELAALRRACRNYCQPRITFVIVQKRHHTRFYAISEADEQDRNYNVPVGTCVDSEIVHPRDLNFYLVSHASILGTARPTKYRLLYDDNRLTDDEIERLSYYLCHLFARCNRSVSYPAPTYNAHLAAARVRAYLEGLNLSRDEDINTIQSKMKDEISKISPMFFV